jgi:chromosome segregation ATPase
MAFRSSPKKLEPETGDALAEKIRDSILGVEGLRDENQRLSDQLDSLEKMKLQLETEIRSLKITVEEERIERRHYRSLANEIVTRLDVVGQTILDVVKRAEEETLRQRRETPGAVLPDVEIPMFLEKVDALVNGRGDEPNGHTQG